MSRCSSDKQGHFSITHTLEKMWKNEIAGLCFESPSPGGMLFVCLFFSFTGSRNSSLFLSSSAMNFIFASVILMQHVYVFVSEKVALISCLP